MLLYCTYIARLARLRWYVRKPRCGESTRLVASWHAAPLTHIILRTNYHSSLSTMAAEQRTAAEMVIGSSSGFASHEMRITQGGKIRAWVEFALKIFEVCKPLSIYLVPTNKIQENEEKALVLHTLPAVAKGKSKENGRTEVTASDGNEPQDTPQSPKGTNADNKEKSGLSGSTTAIPRLITVVEIIKREYVAAMNAKQSPHLIGLFQYNEIGSLEDQVDNKREEGEGDRVKMITEALAGSKE
jgi:hypothetical protein